MNIFQFINRIVIIIFLSIVLSCGKKTEPLHEAVMKNEINSIISLVKNGENINSTGTGGATLLHMAVLNNNIETVNCLLKMNADITITDQNRNTPLHYATGNKDTDIRIIASLISSGASVNAVNNSGETPLHNITKNGVSNEKISLLIHNGADLKIKDNLGNSPFHNLAGKEDCANSFDLMLKKNPCPVSKNKKGETPLDIAVKNNNLPLIKFLLRKKIPPTIYAAVKAGRTDLANDLIKKGISVNSTDNKGITLLQNAVENGDDKMVRFLINRRADIEKGPLVNIAVRKNHLKILSLLLKKGAPFDKIDPGDYTGNPPLHAAILYDNSRAAELLINASISKGKNPNIKNSGKIPALHYALFLYRKKIIYMLINLKADLDITDKNKSTALHCIAFKGSKYRLGSADYEDYFFSPSGIPFDKASGKELADIAGLLIKNGAAVDTKDCEGKTPLLRAVMSKNNRLIDLFLKNGANILVRDKLSYTILHFAAASGMKDICSMAIRKGVDVNSKGYYGTTPLHIAADGRHFYGTALVKFLVKSGAQINKRDAFGKTPLHEAVESKNYQNAQFLIKNGAKCNIKDEKGKTPLDIAGDINSLKIIKLLKAGMKK